MMLWIELEKMDLSQSSKWKGTVNLENPYLEFLLIVYQDWTAIKKKVSVIFNPNQPLIWFGLIVFV